ncbi:hypothetical protein B0H66DRAFT_589382 [Apodospora peruviana]|uniref:Peptidase M20 dimerisation domain-containing protein n=1 Tax=Apodospora peruviana TaxID=516989 RepID=A0AAE0IL98_9PEZI|nr:hypothetical protein B0H66DRAFT_589382 [Apodospora peruviana]
MGCFPKHLTSGYRRHKLTNRSQDEVREREPSAEISDIITRVLERMNQHQPALGFYEDIYKDLHANPELSRQEIAVLRRHRCIGGHGVVGVLKNGPGPIVMLRSELDALPVLEKTELPYASTKRMVDTNGVEKPVSHACGHGMHIASLMAAADILSAARDDCTRCLWFCSSSTRTDAPQRRSLQQATRVHRPDYHRLQYSGEAPNHCRCEIDPRETGAVVTCTSTKAGNTWNVIPDQAQLTVEIRAFTTDTMDKMTMAVKRIVKAERDASACGVDPTFEEVDNANAQTNVVTVSGSVGPECDNFGGGSYRSVNVDETKGKVCSFYEGPDCAGAPLDAGQGTCLDAPLLSIHLGVIHLGTGPESKHVP